MRLTVLQIVTANVENLFPAFDIFFNDVEKYNDHDDGDNNNKKIRMCVRVCVKNQLCRFNR